MRERRKTVDNSGFIERFAGLVLRAFYNRWKTIHTAGEMSKEGVHEGKVRVRKAAHLPSPSGLCAQKNSVDEPRS